MLWNKWKMNFPIFPIFSFWAIFYFVCNFQVFLPTKNRRKKMLSQKMRNVLKRILQFLVFELCSILYFTFVMHSGLDEFRFFFHVRGLHPPKPPVFEVGFHSHIPIWRLRAQAPHDFRLNPQPDWLASESGSQKSLTVNHCWIQDRPYLKK